MKFVLLFVFLSFSFSSTFSQSIQQDSLANFQVKNVIALYDAHQYGNAPIFRGADYIYYTFRMEGDPYFITGNQTVGWVGYDGRVYDPLYLFYDVARNQVVILNNDTLSHIILQNELVDSFHLLGHTFINLPEDYKQNLNNTGFYDMLYRGHIQLLARRIKTMDAVIKGDLVTRRFFVKDRFYVFKDDLYYMVTNKREVFRLFDDKRSELKSEMRKQNLKFKRKNFESTLIKAVALYDQLTK